MTIEPTNTTEERRVRRRRRRRSSKQWLMLTLSLCIAAAVLGVSLCVAWFFVKNHRLLVIGIAYILAAVVILCVRGAVTLLHRIRRHEYSEE